MSNIRTVRDIYAAFGRGDIPAILERLADDVCWDHLPDGGGAERHGVPWLVARTGRDEVGGFFEALGALEFHAFAPTVILADGDTVVALIDEDVTVRATGERIRDKTAHVWTFGSDGRVVEFRHVADTVSTSRRTRRGRSSERAYAGALSSERQRIRQAIVRYGRHGSPSVVSSAAVGSASRP